jgi:hypothetical protein
VGPWEALAAGAAQAPFGMGEELGAALQGFTPMAPSEGVGDQVKRYRQARFENRQVDQAAREQDPIDYYGGLGLGVLGTAPLLPALGVMKGATLVPRLVNAIATGVGQGAAYGAGASEADLTRGEVDRFAGDVGKYAAGGGLLGLGGGLLGQGLGWAARRFAGKADQAINRAQEMGAKEAAEAVASARGKLGAITQQANRLIENLQRLRSTGNATPEQLAKLAQLEESGVVAELERTLMESVLGKAPEAAGEVRAAQAALREMTAGEQQMAENLAQRNLSLREAGSQVEGRARRYLPVAAGTALGTVVGGPVGSAIGALAGAGTRPMVHALRRMARHPSVALRLNRLGEAVTGAGANLLGAGAVDTLPALEREVLPLLPRPAAPAPELPMAADAGGADNTLAALFGAAPSALAAQLADPVTRAQIAALNRRNTHAP